LCNRVAIINDGKVVAVDNPNKLKSMVKEKRSLPRNARLHTFVSMQQGFHINWKSLK